MKFYCKYHPSTYTKSAQIEVCEVVSTKIKFVSVLSLEQGPKSSLFKKAVKVIYGNITHFKFTHLSEDECIIEIID